MIATSHAEDASNPAAIFDVRDLGAVVTGAASGLGFATARVLARNHARVLLIDQDDDGLRDKTEQLAREGLRVRASVADVRDPAALDSAMADVAEWETGLHVVFANAGISAGRGRAFGNGVADIDSEAWQQVLDVNLTGVMHTVRAAVPLIADGGSIVVTSSVAGLSIDPFVGYAYSASKAAVTLFAQNVADELAPRGIRVNVIAPGTFATSIGSANPGDDAMQRALTEATALGRIADPADLEGLALLLASPASRHITGSVFVIDGGVLLRRGTR